MKGLTSPGVGLPCRKSFDTKDLRLGLFSFPRCPTCLATCPFAGGCFFDFLALFLACHFVFLCCIVVCHISILPQYQQAVNWNVLIFTALPKIRCSFRTCSRAKITASSAVSASILPEKLTLCSPVKVQTISKETWKRFIVSALFIVVFDIQVI